MVYITKANFKHILYKFKYKYKYNNLDNILNENIKKIYNENEQKRFLILINLLKECKDFLQSNKIETDFKMTTNKNILNGTLPAFHEDYFCEFLSNDLDAIYLPENLEELNINKIEYEKWLAQNSKLLSKNFDLFVKKQIARFGEDLKFPNEIHEENSGVADTENIKVSKKNLKKEVIRIFDEICEKIPKNSKGIEIAQNSYIAYIYEKEDVYKYHIKENYECLKEIHNLKKKLTPVLEKLYHLEYNPNLSFSKEFLENIGFKPCRNCIF